ncbi:double zinc ribbon domain-containing protein [Halomicrobium urmianum]|uniref:double zinc ribbon domain-containing protein n=1 Tax=Halomicrobium urmianum TaxID=1586233 RepID=UPI001CDA386C|nr:zinc ribbon domain-containing protein [Halomicrobium urmianum]
MSESTGSLVECPLCGEEFDPTVAGGWCTNSDCGEWQHEGTTDAGGDETEADDESEPDGLPGDWDTPAGTKSDDDDDEASGDVGSAVPGPGAEDGEAEGDDATAEAATADEAAQDGEDAADADDGSADGAVEADADGGEDAADEDGDGAPADSIDCPDCGADLSADAEFCTECGSDAVGEDEASDEAELSECPSCGTDVDADDSFCAGCGEDLDAHRGDDDGGLEACPSCGTDVDAADSFCASCGEDLDAHRDGDVLTECPSCGTDVDAADSFCAGCGEDLDAHRGGGTADGPVDSGATAGGGASSAGAGAGEETPSVLALTAYGRSVVVGDDETVGREIRSLLADAGKSEDEAVRIHREHVRFVREDERFYLVDLGENPTQLNGESLQKGDRRPVEPGDELDLSGVVTMTVEEP